jgi:hypothetical protein
VGPLEETVSGERSTILQLLSPSRGGPAFIACSVDGAPDPSCTVDTGNAQNKSVVDFSTGETQTAKVKLTASTGAKVASVKVTAYLVNGAHSSVTIPSP